MKKNILIIAGLIMSYLANAQDMMLLRNGDEIQCKVDMISNGVVSYQKDGVRSDLPASQIYMIKYQKRGNVFFSVDGKSSNAEASSSKLSKKDIAIYLCEGGEIVTSEVKIMDNTISYRETNHKIWMPFISIIPVKINGNWNSIPKEKVFLIRYFDGSRDVISDLQKLEEQARLDALPKVKHPFVPINKDDKYPCPAEIVLNGGNNISAVVYDMEREYVHYRKKEWQDGPIFRMQRSKIKEIILK